MNKLGDGCCLTTVEFPQRDWYKTGVFFFNSLFLSYSAHTHKHIHSYIHTNMQVYTQVKTHAPTLKYTYMRSLPDECSNTKERFSDLKF